MRSGKVRPLAIGVWVLFTTAICYVGGCVYFGISGHSGTAKSKQALLNVYQAAGPRFVAFSTNSFFHKLHFTAPIQWHRAVWRPYVSVTSRVDVVAFKREMKNEPFLYLHAEADWQTTNRYYFQMLQRLKDDSVLMTEGTLDVASGAFGMWSTTLESMTDDPSWQKLTNRGRIEFNFSTAIK